MKKIYTILVAWCLVCTLPVFAIPSTFPGGDSAGAVAGDDPMAWWRDARFGMFIHWGLYAVPAGTWNGETGYGEWIRTSAKIPLDVYDRFATQFNPGQFDADAWAKLARDAGMKYMVITSKHHDGFCLFDTKMTDFNIMSTPFKRDPMKELAAACKKYGLKFCFYHSIMDWHHPDYLPRRDWETGRSAEGADFDRYVAYMKAQLKELLTNYGDIGVLWFDGEWENTWNEAYGKDIYHYVKSLQPAILINNRVGAGRLDMEGMTKEGAFGGDFGTPEQQIPATGLPGIDWETCMTMNDHWGYNKTDKNFKSTAEIIRMISDIASKGGNYLLNVGPTAEGLIPQESVDRLRAVGEWMKVNGEAVYGTQASPFRETPWGRVTRKSSAGGEVLYLHLFSHPDNGELVVPGVLNEPVKALLLDGKGGTPLRVKRNGDALVFILPEQTNGSPVEVIALHVKGNLDLTDPPVFESLYDTFVDRMEIGLRSDRERVEIRYRLDENEPGPDDMLYRTTFMIGKSTTISARCFREGKPVSGTLTRTFKQVEPLGAVTQEIARATLVQGIQYRYFEGEWDSLPDTRALTAVKEGALPDFLFTPRNRPDNFCFEYTALVDIPESSVYTFFTGSDDGSCLWIDGVKVVDNDGLHGMREKEGNIALAKGLHHIRVGFIERTGSDLLTVYVRSPLIPKMVLPVSWLYTGK